MEAAGPALPWPRDSEKRAKGERRVWGGVGPLPRPPGSFSPGSAGLWLVPLGNIQVLACNQYLPGGLPKGSLGRDWQPGSCAGAVRGCRAGSPSLSLPRGPRCSLGLLGAPWCWIPTNLRLLEVSVPVLLVAFPPTPFLAYFLRPHSVSATHQPPAPTPRRAQQLPEREPETPRPPQPSLRRYPNPVGCGSALVLFPVRAPSSQWPS